MSIDSLNIGLSGLDAYGEVLGTSANNVANVGTAGFKSKSVTLHEVAGTSYGEGVTVATTSTNLTPGSLEVTNSGIVEGSNVNLSDEFVKMIAAQKAYEANAKSVEVGRQDLETIVDLGEPKPQSP